MAPLWARPVILARLLNFPVEGRSCLAAANYSDWRASWRRMYGGTGVYWGALRSSLMTNSKGLDGSDTAIP
jgi:hypothetical protein